MTFFDLLRPKWKHSNRTVRMTAVQQLNDTQKLKSIAADQEQPPDIREVARNRRADLLLPRYLTQLDGEPSTATAAAYALGDLADRRAVEPLILVLKREGRSLAPDRVRDHIRSLGGVEAYVDAMLNGMRMEIDGQGPMTAQALVMFPLARSLGVRNINDRSGWVGLYKTMLDSTWTCRKAAAIALGQLGGAAAEDALKTAAAKDQNPDVRYAAKKALSTLVRDRAI